MTTQAERTADLVLELVQARRVLAAIATYRDALNEHPMQITEFSAVVLELDFLLAGHLPAGQPEDPHPPEGPT